MNDFNIVTITKENISIFKECFYRNGSKKNNEVIEWQFLKNPINKQYVDIAIDIKNNQTAAIYAIFPIKFKIKNSVLIGSQSLDTITDIDYRGKGLFINLAKDVYEKASQNDVKLVYGFPNGNSIYGFQKKLAWEVLDPVPFLIKPFRTSYFTNKISWLSWLPNINLVRSNNKVNDNYRVESKNEFPLAVNEVWTKFSKTINVAVNRDKEYLDWRYINKPLEDYKIVHAYNEENKYIGFVVFAVKSKHGGKIGYIMELVYNTDYKDAGEFLLKHATNQINQSKADCVLSWCLEHSPNYEAYKAQKFYNMPEKFRPIELHFGARSFDDNLYDVINKRENWYLSYSDSDTV
ncbi:GNAT family N-acetyltransferase [uncultured Flavobacterium sp.]|uniref:GNAT family N-acetyltransferase n=1 Tax=uncultured Flavobacterium sp. TaxID=165435 RepID=UPI0030EE7DB5|tara:strand:- start:63064 stop:64110 length:1047 start_codon:yes stop_codon:yes gene_type:complete